MESRISKARLESLQLKHNWKSKVCQPSSQSEMLKQLNCTEMKLEDDHNDRQWSIGIYKPLSGEGTPDRLATNQPNVRENKPYVIWGMNKTPE